MHVQPRMLACYQGLHMSRFLLKARKEESLTMRSQAKWQQILFHVLTSPKCPSVGPYPFPDLTSTHAGAFPSLKEAFRIQKAAYRHANGGSTAPSLTQDVSPNLPLGKWTDSGPSRFWDSSLLWGTNEHHFFQCYVIVVYSSTKVFKRDVFS